MVSIKDKFSLVILVLAVALSAFAKPPSDGARTQFDCNGDCETPVGKNLSKVKLSARQLIDFTCEANKAQTGMASYYGKGDGFKGKKTASGEILGSKKLTAAHRTLPFGTLVRITSTTTKKHAIVRINDRGPFFADRMIDLNYAAAKAIGLSKSGVDQVEMQVCTIPDNK